MSYSNKFNYNDLLQYRQHGALLVSKPVGITSYGVIDELKKATSTPYVKYPKMGHGGTLDPFATGLLVVLVGRAAKLARYFLGSNKRYEGTIQFGATTVTGDLTVPITETTEVLPHNIEIIRDIANRLTKQPYLQIPPMYSAKKHQGKPLYELARSGIEVEREPKLCNLFEFEIQSYKENEASFSLLCSSGTYVRTLAQDLGRMLGSLGVLKTLSRTQAGQFALSRAIELQQLSDLIKQGDPIKPFDFSKLNCWIPFNELLLGYQTVEASAEEVRQLRFGQQQVLFNLAKRELPAQDAIDPSRRVICHQGSLIAVACETDSRWQLELVI